MNMIRLNRQEILQSGQAAHLARTVLATSRPKALHAHDFYELLWVQNGKIRQHTDGGHTDLAEGALLFIRPGHTHALQGRGEEAIVVSVTIDPAVIDELGNAYPDLAGRYFWAAGTTPERFQRDFRQLAELNQSARLIDLGAADPLSVTAFLTPLLAALESERKASPDTAPEWLREACRAAHQPEVFRDGAAGFVRVAGRAHAHVSRSARLHLGQSPSEYVNAIRMDYAARMLTGSADTLAEIAADVGLPNLSHFHKLFLAHHGTTPAHYRRTRQRNTVQPDL